MFDVPAQRRPGSPEPADLGVVTSTWHPVVARDIRPIGFRLTLQRADQQPEQPPLAAVLDSVLGGFVADQGTSFPHGLVVLAPLDFSLDESLTRWNAPRNVLLEVGPHAADDAERLHLLFDVQRHGVRLALRVEGSGPVARERLPLFQYLLADAQTYGKAPPETGLLALNVDSRAAADAAFKTGAHAIVGWPLHESVAKASGSLEPTQTAVLELIKLVQSDADVADLERAFRHEPLLAYLLLNLANSPAFVRTAPIASINHAIQLLGYKRLVKWLVLLLAVASKGGQALPFIYTAVARGFLAEQLAIAAEKKGLFADACFIVGAFSLLDKITGRPQSELFSACALPDDIVQAVQAGVGPYAPFLDLTLALEAGNQAAIQAAAAAAGLALRDVNKALLQSLSATDALQSVV